MTEDVNKRARRVSLTVEELSLLEAALGLLTVKQAVDLRARLKATVAETIDPENQRIIDAYRAGLVVEDGECEMDDDAEVSIGEDDGAYVMTWTWVTSEEAGLCVTCRASYDGAGDGFDGECPDCADKTEAAREVVCARCGDKTTMGESPDEEHCPDCYDLLEHDEAQDDEDEEEEEDYIDVSSEGVATLVKADSTRTPAPPGSYGFGLRVTKVTS